MLKAVNLATIEGTKERESLRKERQEILNRKAQGDKAVIYDLPEGEAQSLPYDNDEAWWRYQESRRVNGDS